MVFDEAGEAVTNNSFSEAEESRRKLLRPLPPSLSLTKGTVMNHHIKAAHLRISHIIAIVFCLFTLASPTTFALEKARRMVTQEIVAPLIKEITGQDAANIELNADGSITFSHQGNTFLLTNLKRHSISGVASGSVTVFDKDGDLMQTVIFNRGISVVGDNQINFNATVLSAGGEVTGFYNGVMMGDRANSGIALVATTKDEGLTSSYSIDYKSTDLQSEGTGSTAAALVDDAAVIVVVVIFVLVTCVLFGWWGCN